MYVYKQNDSSISIDAWIEACQFEPTEESGLIKIDNKDSIVFMFKEDYQKSVNYLNGEKDIPSLEDGIDILGDISEIEDIYQSIEVSDYYIGNPNDIVDTRGQIAHYHNIFGKISTVETEDIKIKCETYSHRKGIPSFIWGESKQVWVE